MKLFANIKRKIGFNNADEVTFAGVRLFRILFAFEFLWARKNSPAILTLNSLILTLTVDAIIFNVS